MYYQLATISELLGRNDEARHAYQEFLQRYDLPMPAHRALVEEARAALARLTHQGDPPPTQ
jgi:TolA-binding protein